MHRFVDELCVPAARDSGPRPSLLRALAYVGGGAVPSPSPEADPEGWNVYDPVKITGTLFDARQVSVQCTVSDFLPISYNTTSLSQETQLTVATPVRSSTLPHSPLEHFSSAHGLCSPCVNASSCMRAILPILYYSRRRARRRTCQRLTCSPAPQTCMEHCRQFGSTRGRTVAE